MMSTPTLPPKDEVQGTNPRVLDNTQTPQRHADYDRRLEAAITMSFKMIITADTQEVKRHHFNRWKKLLKARSPQQLAVMEAELNSRIGL